MMLTTMSRVFEVSTLSELQQFVSDCEKSGMPKDTRVVARVKARFNSDGGEITRLTTVKGK